MTFVFVCLASAGVLLTWDLCGISSRGTTLLPFSDPAYQCLPTTQHLTFSLHVSSFSSISFVLYSAIPLSQRGATLPNLTSPPTQLGIKRFVNSPPPRSPSLPGLPPFASIYGRPQALFVSLEATYRVGLGRSLDPVRDAFFVFGEATTYPTTPLPISCPRPTLAPFLAKHIPMLSQKDISTSLSRLSYQNTYKSFCPIECLDKQS